MKEPVEKADIARRANAVAAAVLVVAFLGHALVAAFAGHAGAASAPVLLLRCLLGLVLVHVGFSVATTVCMMKDTVRPPSARKRRHQWLKWASGCVLLAALALHVLRPWLPAAFDVPLSLVVLAALTWHGWMGMKSLVHDLRLPKGAKRPLRAALGALAVLAMALLFALR